MELSVLLFEIWLIFLFGVRGFEGEENSNFDDFDVDVYDNFSGEKSGVQLMAAPVNSECSGAVELQLGVEVVFNNSKSSSGDSSICKDVSKTVWFYYVSQFDGTLSAINTIKFSGITIAAYESYSCPTEPSGYIQCNSNDFIYFVVSKGQKFYFTVSSSEEASGIAGIYLEGSPTDADTVQVISDSIIYVGTEASVYILSSTPGELYTATLTCGQSYTEKAGVYSVQAFSLTIPTGFLGACIIGLIKEAGNTKTVVPKNVISLIPVSFEWPDDNADIIHGIEFSIRLYAPQTLPDVELTVSQKCGELAETSYPPVAIGVSFAGTLPTGYTGQCLLYTGSSSFYTAATRTVNAINGTLKFIFPSDGWTYKAGSSISVEIRAVPAGEFNVSLQCYNPNDPSIQSGFNSRFPKDFTIGTEFYGDSCSLSIYGYDTSIYGTPDPVPLIVVQPVNFEYPVNGETFNIEDGININFQLNAVESIGKNPVDVTQNCGTGKVFVYNNVNVNEDYVADQTPANFKGQCTFSSSASGLYAASYPNVTVFFTNYSLNIENPQYGQVYQAGKPGTVTISANPNGRFTCLFTALDFQQPQSYQRSGIPSGVDYDILIPNSLYGRYSFTLTDFPTEYPAPVPVEVNVTQQLYLAKPESGSSVNPFALIEILVSADSKTLNNQVVVTLDCSGQTSGPINVNLNSVYSYQNVSTFKGLCLVSCSVGGFSSFLIPFDPVSFYLRVVLAFSSVPFQVVNGLSFEISIKSLNAAYVPVTISLLISCSGVTQTFNNVAINFLNTLNMNLAISGLGPYSCTFTNVPDDAFSSISASTTLLIPLNQEQKAEVAKNLVFA